MRPQPLAAANQEITAGSQGAQSMMHHSGVRRPGQGSLTAIKNLNKAA